MPAGNRIRTQLVALENAMIASDLPNTFKSGLMETIRAIARGLDDVEKMATDAARSAQSTKKDRSSFRS